MRSAVFYALVAAAIICFALFAYTSHASLDAGRPSFVVLAWNETGNRGAAPICGPLSGLRAQVVRKGNPPRVVADGITVEYRIIDGVGSGTQRRGVLRDAVYGIMGVSLERSGRGPERGWGGMAGCMLPEGDCFKVECLPAASVDKDGRWDPYLRAKITARDSHGNELARTQAAVPTSDEYAIDAGNGRPGRCSCCHSGVPDADAKPGGFLTGRGHGGLFCPSCHGSPHGTLPSSEASGVYREMQYQPPRAPGRLAAISSCAACHETSRGPSSWSPAAMGRFAAEHAGAGPKIASGCNICHTSFSMQTKNWPHGFAWWN